MTKSHRVINGWRIIRPASARHDGGGFASTPRSRQTCTSAHGSAASVEQSCGGVPGPGGSAECALIRDLVFWALVQGLFGAAVPGRGSLERSGFS